MPFPFRFVGDLLEAFDDGCRGPKAHNNSSHVVVARWFQQHRQRLDLPDTDACALLSTLLPDRRTDRVFCIQSTKLEGIIGKVLTLGASRVKELRRYREPGLGFDLADCVEKILSVTPNPVSNDITVEEIDATLEEIAARCKFSSPAMRAKRKHTAAWSSHDALGDIYRQLSARDAKWFTRLVLKDFQTSSLNHDQVLRHYHPLLPQMLKVRDDLSLATAFLRHLKYSQDVPSHISIILKPKLGVKVGRQPWYKGRSIKHCIDMCRRRIVSCEQKLDGEYCQIHIDRSKGRPCIQIFSKSGKDSTVDRAGVHDAIRQSLRLDKPDCQVKHSCILEGELLVYSTKDQAILPFHKIRKHVSRSGVFLGTDRDSQLHDYEQLMIVYFDVLLIDNESLLPISHSQRRMRLAQLITCIPGKSDLVHHEMISFSRNSAPAELRKAFAATIVGRTEGLVLKPDEPYFDFSAASKPHASGNIKLKKEYVQGWGDVGDFAVIGASYDAVKAKSYSNPPPRWTHFFIACLQNKIQVIAKNEKPRFKHVNVVELNNNLMNSFQTQCQPLEVAFEANDLFEIDADSLGDAKKPTVLFGEPLVFDMRCFSFDKSSNNNFWSMRFPKVSKIHFDRSFLDTMTFEDLQNAARESTTMAEQEDSQELRRWISGLERADPRGVAVDAVSSQGTFSEACLTPSPIRRKNPKKGIALGAITEELSVAPVSAIPSGPNRSGQMQKTSPRSSAVAAVERCSPLVITSVENSSQSRKRIASPNAAGRLRKKSCKEGREPSSRPTSLSFQGRHHQPVAGGRAPLGEVEINRSFNSHRMSQTRYGNAALSGFAETETTLWTNRGSRAISPHGDHNATGKCRPLCNDAQPARNPKASFCFGQFSGQASSCPHSGACCFLARRSIMLAPCVASYAFVSETLLGAHGISGWATDPTQWRSATTDKDGSSLKPDTTYRPESSKLARRISAVTEASLNPGSSTLQNICPASVGVTRQQLQGPRTRRICFVESQRKQETAAFLKAIEQAGLRKSSSRRKSSKTQRSSPGKSFMPIKEKIQEREWVAVYDWRVLEVLTDIETGKIPVPKSDPWRRFWVGLA